MQPHGALEIFVAHVLKWTNFHNPGVVDQDVDPAEPIDDRAYSGLNLSAIAQIAFDGENFVAAGSEIGFCACEFLGVTREESNLSALVANMSCEHESQSARTTGDEDNFVTQPVTSRAKNSSGDPRA